MILQLPKLDYLIMYLTICHKSSKTNFWLNHNECKLFFFANFDLLWFVQLFNFNIQGAQLVKLLLIQDKNKTAADALIKKY